VIRSTIQDGFEDAVAIAVPRDRAGPQQMGGSMVLQCATPQARGSVDVDTDLEVQQLSYRAHGTVSNFGVEMRTTGGVTIAHVTAHVDWYYEELR